MQNSNSKGMERSAGLLELTEIHPLPQLNNSEQSKATLHKLQPIIGGRANWKCLEPSDLHYIRKYKPKMLSNIKISRLSFESVGMRGTEDLRRTLNGCKRISSLSFNQGPKDDKNTEHLIHLLNSSNHFKKLRYCYSEKERVLSQETVKSLTRLRRCRNISGLEIYLKSNKLTQNQVVHHLSTQFKGLPKLRSLSLDVTNFEYETTLPLKIPKSLTSLSLNFRGKPLAYHPIFILLSNIQSCNSLEHICLKSFRFSNIEPQEAQIWANLFEKTQSLQTLSVIKDFGDGQQLEAIKIFFYGFQCLKHLKVLALDFTFNFTEQNPETLADLFYGCLSTSLGSLTELEELQLYFLNDLNITNFHLQYLAQALQNCRSLKKLKLTLPSEKVSDKGIISFAQNLQKLIGLKVLLIHFPSAIAGPESMKILFESIGSLHLTSLSLALSPGMKSIFMWFNSLLNRSPTISLFSAINYLKCLSTLELNLAKFGISTSNYQHFSLALKNLKCLQSLSLQLPQSDANQKYQGFQSFLSVLKEFPFLYSLYLTFCGIKFCDHEVSLISENLKDCKWLEILELCFEQAQKLNEESLSYLQSGIQGLTSMKNLKLEFFQNVRFDSGAVFELLKAFTVLKRLKTLKFSEDCTVPRAAALPLQLKDYQELKSLQSFVMNESRYI